MNHFEIAVRTLQAVVATAKDTNDNDNTTAIYTLNAEMMSLGYILSEPLFNTLKTWDIADIQAMYTPLIDALKQIKGADVRYKPMYPNFPGQVVSTSDLDLYRNAILHYWSAGEWIPRFYKLPRPLRFEAVKYQEIGLASDADFLAVFSRLLRANESLSDTDKDIVRWFLFNSDQAISLANNTAIPFSENKCVVAAILLELKQPFSTFVDSATDILRIASYLSGGDISLAANTRFKSFPRSTRRALTVALEKVIREEDIRRHKNKWVKLFHSLHVGDYSNRVYRIAKKARNNLKMESFNGKIECYLGESQLNKAVSLLATRPGEFARRLDELLRHADKRTHQQQIVERFVSVANQVPTRVLLQVLGHFQHRHNASSHTVVFPKGATQKGVLIERSIPGLAKSVTKPLIAGIKHCLLERFATLAPLGPVWIDPALVTCPIPSQQRSASAGSFQVARGTRLPLNEKQTLRFFIYWVGQDIDLSATFHGEDFSHQGHVSYTQLKSTEYQAYHSGDITSAPKGACEFIDITTTNLAALGIRYIAMNVLVYNGPTFDAHETCYVGWMTRDKPNSNEIFDPKTVEQKIDVRAKSRNVIPVIFDVVKRQAIWTDLSMSGRARWGGNNVESNQASIEQKLAAIIHHRKVSLGDLFQLHAKARGYRVNDEAGAEQMFALDKGVTPFNIDVINADFIGD